MFTVEWRVGMESPVFINLCNVEMLGIENKEIDQSLIDPIDCIFTNKSYKVMSVAVLSHLFQLGQQLRNQKVKCKPRKWYS